MRHAQNDILDAQGAAALDDLFERRDQRFAAIETKPLGAGIFDVEEFLEPLGFGQFVQDRPLALGGEGDFLVRAFDALLDPGLGLGIGDVHELDAQRAAIGTFEDFEHLGHGGKFEPEIIVDEDFAGVIGLGKPVSRRIELGGVLAFFEPERIEIGVQMPAHAVGADHHDGVDRIPCRLHDGFCGNDLAAGFGLFGDRLLGLDRHFAPIAIERRDHLAIGGARPVGALPAWAIGVFGDAIGTVGKIVEELRPTGIDAFRVGLVAGVQRVDVIGIAAIKEGSEEERFVLVLSCHFALDWGSRSPSVKMCSTRPVWAAKFG